MQDRIQQCSSLSHLASVLDRDLRLLRPLEHRGLVLDIAFKALSLCPHAARLAEPLGPTRPINKAAITVLSFIQGLMPDVLRFKPSPQYLMLYLLALVALQDLAPQGTWAPASTVEARMRNVVSDPLYLNRAAYQDVLRVFGIKNKARKEEGPLLQLLGKGCLLPPLLVALDELGLEECVDGALLDDLKLRQLLWPKGRQGALRLRELMSMFCAIFTPGTKPAEQGGQRQGGLQLQLVPELGAKEGLKLQLTSSGVTAEVDRPSLRSKGSGRSEAGGSGSSNSMGDRAARVSASETSRATAAAEKLVAAKAARAAKAAKAAEATAPAVATAKAAKAAKAAAAAAAAATAKAAAVAAATAKADKLQQQVRVRMPIRGGGGS